MFEHIIGHLVAHQLGRAKAISLLYLGCILIVMAILPLFVMGFLGSLSYSEVVKERRYQQEHGAEWRAYYETEQGSLTKARVRAVVAVPGIFVIGGLYVYLCRQFVPAITGANGLRMPGRRTRKRRVRKSRRAAERF